jgi:hypothetical protein
MQLINHEVIAALSYYESCEKVAKLYAPQGAISEVEDEVMEQLYKETKEAKQRLIKILEGPYASRSAASNRAAGIVRAKAAGKYRGRKPILNEVILEAKKLIAEGVSKREVASQLGIAESTLYRYLSQPQLTLEVLNGHTN